MSEKRENRRKTFYCATECEIKLAYSDSFENMLNEIRTLTVFSMLITSSNLVCETLKFGFIYELHRAEKLPLLRQS